MMKQYPFANILKQNKVRRKPLLSPDVKFALFITAIVVVMFILVK